MRYEWLVIILVTLVVAVLFAFMEDASTVAMWGWLSFASGFGWMGYLIAGGRRAKRYWRSLGKKADHVLESHRDDIAVLTLFVLVGVVGIEIAVRKAGGLWGNPWFVTFHLMLAVSMMVVFAFARFKFTGLRSPQHHWKLVYVFLVLYGATLVTGSMLLEDKFHFYGSVPQSVVHTK